MIRWFVAQNDSIAGPFSTEEIKAKSIRDTQFRSSMIWGWPIAEWKSMQWWLKQIDEVLSKIDFQEQDHEWYYAHGGESFGPLSRRDLLKQLGTIPEKSDLMLWKEGMKAWTSILEFHDIMDAIGIGRRQHHRRKIAGTAKVTVDTHIHLAQIESISIGGCGLTQVENVITGEIIHLEIKSEAFYDVIRVSAEVRYINNGYVGLKFQSLNSEAQAMIIQYIRGETTKSQTTGSETTKQAA